MLIKVNLVTHSATGRVTRDFYHCVRSVLVVELLLTMPQSSLIRDICAMTTYSLPSDEINTGIETE